MGLLATMLGNVLFLDNDGALQAEPIRSEGAGDTTIAQTLANLWEDRDLVVYGAQNGLVMLDAGICCFLALLQQTLHMFYMLCERNRHFQQANKGVGVPQPNIGLP